MSQSSDITFEAGYRRLQDIAERLGSDEVPVHEMCDLFAEGKGLEQALGDYLARQRERVEAIERGEGMRAFRVVPPEGAPAAANGSAPAAANGSAPTAANGSAPTTANEADPAAAPEADAAPAAPPQDESLPF